MINLGRSNSPNGVWPLYGGELFFRPKFFKEISRSNPMHLDLQKCKNPGLVKPTMVAAGKLRSEDFHTSIAGKVERASKRFLIEFGTEVNNMNFLEDG